MTIKPGYGSDSVHLRQSTSSLEKVFGLPHGKRRSGPLREYWLYPDQGFDCVVSTRSGRVLGVFFNKDSVAGDAGFMDRTADQVEKSLGPPDQSGGGFQLSDGEFVGRWLSYRDGIGFHLDKTGRVQTVVVFGRRREPRRALSANQALRVPGLAALRAR